MPRRRRLAVLAAGLALATAVAACTAGPEGTGDARTEQPSPSPSRLSAELNTTTRPVVVVEGTAPGEVSIDVSRTLFATAPAVVVARAGDPSQVRRGAAHSARLGVPLLLDDPPPTDDADAAGTSERRDALAAEIERLRATAVLAVGPTTPGPLEDSLEVPVHTDPARLPAIKPARDDASVAVLTRCGAEDAVTCAAVSATARAAGAAVVPVAGDDLRADPDAIAALAEHRPSRVVAVGPGFGPADRLADRVAVARTGTQLPGGGQVLFPGRRLVALYGHPGTPSLGVLGEQPLEATIARAQEVAAGYEALSSVPVVPTLEIIATVAQRAAGSDGDYSGEAPVELLEPWVAAAREAGVYVVLDLQPGRAHFLDQAKRYADLLRHPHVGLALDPEWRLEPDQLPLEQIGGVDADEVNEVSAWLAELTARHDLPQKLLVLHQFRLSMIRDPHDLDLDHDNVQVLIHMDGQGTPALKDVTWEAVKAAAPAGVPFGWKNFHDEDEPMLTPSQTMAKEPAPLMVSYQ